MSIFLCIVCDSGRELAFCSSGDLTLRRLFSVIDLFDLDSSSYFDIYSFYYVYISIIQVILSAQKKKNFFFFFFSIGVLHPVNTSQSFLSSLASSP